MKEKFERGAPKVNIGEIGVTGNRDMFNAALRSVGKSNMDDISKIEKGIINTDVNGDDSFIDKIIESYENPSSSLELLNANQFNLAYSTDVNKFNNDCLNFINYIKECINNNDACYLYMLRRGNTIRYGKYNQGVKIDKDSIRMVSNEDLRKLYELLQSEFESSFIFGCRHIFGKGWMLNPTIANRAMVDIDSSNRSDLDWFYEECYKERKCGNQKKK